MKEITSLSKVFAMSIPSFEADLIKDNVAFFQAVKSRINKFNPSGIKSNYEIDSAIKQIVDEALSSDGVIDVFEAAGIRLQISVFCQMNFCWKFRTWSKRMWLLNYLKNF